MPRKLNVYVETEHGRRKQEMFVNNNSSPTEITTDTFIGRISVRLRDYAGSDSGDVYFKGRSRRFAIHIEGRFKPRPGQDPYTAAEVEWGAEFDRPPKISSAIIATGQKIIAYVDPVVSYKVTSTGRCRFMGACLVGWNIVAGWPCPNAPQKREEEAAPSVAKQKTPSSSAGENLGATSSLPQTSQGSARVGTETPADDAASIEGSDSDPEFGQIDSGRHSDSACANSDSTKAKKSKVKRILHTMRSKLSTTANSAGNSDNDTAQVGTLQSNGDKATSSKDTPRMGESFFTPPETPTANLSSAFKWDRPNETESVNDVLGEWQFSDPATELSEVSPSVSKLYSQPKDNAFLFDGQGVSTSKRRKKLSDQATRESLILDPDMVYAGSFHSNTFDFNTYNLHVGPINLNMESYLGGMPLGFALGTNRMVDDGQGGQAEEVFFRLVFELET